MIWLTLIGMVISILNLLMNWFSSQQSRVLTDRQKRRINHVLWQMDQCRAQATALGCKAEEDSEESARAEDTE